MDHTLNFNGNNLGTEIAAMSHVKFKHIKGMAIIVGDHISKMKSIGLCDSLNP